MDKSDVIIRQQMEVIRQMTESNLRHLSDDIWGKPQDSSVTPAAPAASAENASEATPEKAEEPAETIDDLKKELAAYIGLERVKTEVENLINMATVMKLREKNDLPTVDMSLHMVFTGNPGTGKTMIARLMARIYKCLGILSKGQLVEVDRSGLVAGYVGQTAIKTAKVIESAKGGVLFVDEAYALNGGGNNDFGQEAIDTLLKAMEDNRDDLIVIVAGYDELMGDFIASNPGLQSRFNRYLHFDDYSLDEMMAIFDLRVKSNGYLLDENAQDEMRAFIERENTDPTTFGNARGVRNLFERVLVEQNNRVAAIPDATKDDLMRITEADINAAMAAEPPREKPLTRGERAMNEWVNAFQASKAASETAPSETETKGE